MTMHKVDTGVIDSCRQGDREVLRVIFEAYKDKVYSLALCYLNGDVDAAKDLTQGVFIKLITRLEQFRGDAEFTTWLYRVVANACLDERRKRRRWFSLEDSVEVGHMVVRRSLETLQLQKEMDLWLADRRHDGSGGKCSRRGYRLPDHADYGQTKS